MIEVVGKDCESKRLLRVALAEIEERCGRLEGVVAWGRAARPGEIGNERLLNAVSQLCRLGEAGIETPQWTTDVEEAKRWVRQGSMVFGRKLRHTQGRDIVGPRHRRWGRREWWSRVVEGVVREWRIHVMRVEGRWRCIGRGLKVQVEPPTRRLPVRSRRNGWRLSHREEPPEGVRRAGVRAVEAVGYLWGAVDVLECEDGRVVVLEVNSRPGMDNYTASRYAWGLYRVVEERREHYGVDGR